MTDFDAIAQGMTQAVPFAGYLGLDITSVAAGEAVVVLPERAELTNHVGSQHAGALFTVAEAASGAAFVGAFVERMGEVTPLARSAEISYEKIAKGPIEARARLAMPAEEALATLDSEGKVVFPCEIELFDGEGTKVATATVQWHVRLNKPADVPV
jgi:acyl-coenzyme A thioesterase PaaI-like protein